MKQRSSLISPLKRLALGAVVLAASVSKISVASASSQQASANPPRASVSGPQAHPAVAPGSRDAKQTAALGTTKLVATNSDGTPKTNVIKPLVGAVAGVDFQTFYNYCWRNLVYTPVKNTTSVTKYVQIRLYNQGSSRDFYASIAPGAVYYPTFYGVDGAYSSYLYVWNGSSYQYDEYKGGTNTCNVSVTRTYNTGGWVQLKIQNLGTAYATQVSNELAPFAGAGTYTGLHYDYPAAGGAAIYRWFQVGTQPYGINSYTSGSFNTPYNFLGDL